MDGDTIFSANFDFSSDDEAVEKDKDSRTFQSQEDFLRQKASWSPKIENRKVIRLLMLMQELLRYINVEPEAKFDLLGMKSVAELLYLERRYEEALHVGEKILQVEAGEKIGSADRAEVEDLVHRCRRRLSDGTYGKRK
jgi:hypothetical protein